MDPTVTLIIGLVSWALFITLLLVSERSFRVLFAGAPANGFAPDGSDVTGFRQRLVRVHANNYENLALLMAIPVLALLLEKSAILSPLAIWVLIARIAQGSVHLVSASVLAVYFRVTFYTVQLLITAYWIVALAEAA